MNRVVKRGTGGQNDVLIPGLPHEIALLCIARVPRSCYRIMSKVCQGWRSLLPGRVLLELRQELSLTEEWLYLWTETKKLWRCFDPSTQTWSKLPPMPNGNWVVDHSSFGSLDGKLFAVGGHPPSSNLYGKSPVSCKTVSYFDARSHCWKRAADLNIGRTGCLVEVINGRLYVFGGWTRGFWDVTSTGEVYDPVIDTWRFVSSLESPISFYNSVTMGDKFYAMGQELEEDNEDELVGFVYDPQTDKWENMADGLSGGWQVQTTVLNGKLYTAGDEYVAGHLEDGYTPEIDQVIQVYNPSKDVWERMREFWWEGADMFAMDWMRVVSFCGKLCVVSVETNHDDLEEEKFSMISMVMLEVNESTEGPTCTATFRDEFYGEFEEDLGQRLTDKSVQIIAL